MVPPGELICTMTAGACDFSSRSRASTRSLSLRIRPSIWTRAIELEVVSASRADGVAKTPMATTATTATAAAVTRQKVSLRRILRRSTITSESSDIEILLRKQPWWVARDGLDSVDLERPDYINCDAI